MEEASCRSGGGEEAARKKDYTFTQKKLFHIEQSCYPGEYLRQDVPDGLKLVFREPEKSCPDGGDMSKRSRQDLSEPTCDELHGTVTG
jgi:hypothetical protein